MKAVTTEIMNTWADDPTGPVALHLKQKLLPVEGENAVVFPPTYAAKDRGGTSDYNIDQLADGTKVVTIDSVGSQANRMEPLFKSGEFASLVPQIDIRYAEDMSVSIFEAGHRLGDAVVRCSSLREDARRAFESFLQKGDASLLARLAPTSLVFGVWDSRDTQAKLPRIVQSVIRGWDVEKLRRSAQFTPALDYAATGVLREDEQRAAESNDKSEPAQRGFVHVPATGAPGGVVVRGSIERDVTVNLIALRRLDTDQSSALRRYILGLALVAASAPFDGFLRQGCLLTPDPAHPAAWEVVARDGQREPLKLEHRQTLAYAQEARKGFPVADNRVVDFDRKLAQADLSEGDAKKVKKEKAAARK